MTRTQIGAIALLGLFGIVGVLNHIFTPYGIGLNSLGDEHKIQFEAISTRDISICDKIHHRWWGATQWELRSVCYRVYAKAHPTENICPRLLAPSKASGPAIAIDFQLCSEAQEDAK